MLTSPLRAYFAPLNIAASLRADALAGRVVQGVFRHVTPDPRPEYVDLDRRADRTRRRDVCVCDRPLDSISIAAAGDAAHDRALGAHRLGAQRDLVRVVEHEARKPRFGRSLALLQQRVAADELALVELDAEAQPRLVRVDVGRDVAAPDAVAL